MTTGTAYQYCGKQAHYRVQGRNVNRYDANGRYDYELSPGMLRKRRKEEESRRPQFDGGVGRYERSRETGGGKAESGPSTTLKAVPSNVGGTDGGETAVGQDHPTAIAKNYQFTRNTSWTVRPESAAVTR